MTYIYRRIKNKNYYYKDNCDFEWLKRGDLIADVFLELNTCGGKLSVFQIDEDQSNLCRVIAAFSASRENVTDIDYVLVPGKDLRDQFNVVKSPGHTPDDIVNELHIDIVGLTPTKLLELVGLFWSNKDKMKRQKKRRITKLIWKGIEERQIDFKCMHVNQQSRFAGGVQN